MIVDTSATRRPELVGWGITKRCNLSCPHCYSSASKDAPGELPLDLALEVLEALAGLGTRRIGWTGGEPLLRKDLEVLVARAAALGIDSGITTNGTPLTPRRVESLVASGLGTLQVSLDGSTAEKNECIRGAGARDFERVLRGVQLAREAGLTVHMAMLVGAQTLDDVPDYLELARSLGVQSVRLCGYVPWGSGIRDAVQARLDLRGRLGDLRGLVEGLPENGSPQVLLDPGFGPLPPGFDYHECVAGMHLLYLDPEGDVYPCTSLLAPRFRVGNVRETPVAQLWHDPRMTETARYPREAIHGPCRTCDVFERCRGACRGIAYSYTGDLDASFPLCLARATPSSPSL